MSVYSTLFAANATTPGALTTVYTVPQLQTVVVRDIEYQFYGTGTVTWTVQGSSSGSPVLIHGVINYAPVGSSQWSGRVVLPGGSLLQVISSLPQVAYSISGYLLTP